MAGKCVRIDSSARQLGDRDTRYMTFEYFDGWQACLAGNTKCPYEIDSIAWALWTTGWQECNEFKSEDYDG